MRLGGVAVLFAAFVTFTTAQVVHDEQLIALAGIIPPVGGDLGLTNDKDKKNTEAVNTDKDLSDNEKAFLDKCRPGRRDWPRCRDECRPGGRNWPRCRDECRPGGRDWPRCRNECRPGGWEWPRCRKDCRPGSRFWPRCRDFV